jgi:Protein of unknown function (DUF1566)
VKKTLVSAFVFIFFLMITAVAFAALVPDTGQTRCYNATVEITCPSPGKAFYGQDAQYNINPMSYTKLDGSGGVLPDYAVSWVMVKDNVTGLTWEMKNSMDGAKDYSNPHDSDNTYTWYDSNPATNGGNAGTPGDGTDTEDFIKALNDANYGGYNDWRMPTIKELTYIVNYSIPSPVPTIDAGYFPNTVSSFYWSCTSLTSSTGLAWGVGFDSGYGFNNKFYSLYVRAVRGGQTQSAYTDNSNGTVTDASTGLMWQQVGSSGTWEQSLAYCEGLNLGGYTDWRLPTIKELESLVDYSRYGDPAINTTYFPGAGSSGYWSSTTSANYTYFAWGVGFYYGSDAIYNKGRSLYVRAVRGGQLGSLGLWAETTGRASIWTMDADGNKTSTLYYGPYTGWAPRSYHKNSDGTANMLWGRTDGYVSLWAAIDAGGNPTSKLNFGPYADWTARSYNKNSDGTANMLWGRTDGLTALWMMDASNNPTSELVFGPYPGWTAKTYHGNSDGTANMLWVRTDGYVSLWTMDDSGNPTSKMKYGPYEGWTANSYYRNSDGTGRMLWVRTDGYVSLWNMDVNGNPISKMKYGPYEGWTAQDFD